MLFRDQKRLFRRTSHTPGGFPTFTPGKLYKIADVGLEGDGGARAELRSDQTRASFSRDGTTIIIIMFSVDNFLCR